MFMAPPTTEPGWPNAESTLPSSESVLKLRPVQTRHRTRDDRNREHESARRPARAAVLLALTMSACCAPDAAAQALGYAVAGPAGVSGFFDSSASSIHAAGGGEALAGRLVGVGGEFGALANSSNVLLVASANGVVHLPVNPLSPFVTAGYTRMESGEGGFNAWNVGAGADYWAKSRLGLRVEFRDHVRPDARGTVHYWTVRAGVVFR